MIRSRCHSGGNSCDEDSQLDLVGLDSTLVGLGGEVLEREERFIVGAVAALWGLDLRRVSIFALGVWKRRVAWMEFVRLWIRSAMDRTVIQCRL